MVETEQDKLQQEMYSAGNDAWESLHQMNFTPDKSQLFFWKRALADLETLKQLHYNSPLVQKRKEENSNGR